MFTDENWCGPCCDRGVFNDGENYCIHCEHYICLSCALIHGQNCRIGAETIGKIRDDRKDVAGVNETNTDAWEYQSALYDHTTSFHDKTTRTLSSKSDYRYPHLHTLRLNAERKVNSAQDLITDSFDNEAGETDTDNPNSVRQKSKELETSQERLNGKRSVDSKQNFSARCGTVRLQQSPSNEERVKLQRCTRHPELTIENFCNIHEALCCEECLNTEHKHCIVQPVDEVAHGVNASQDLLNVVKEFDDLKKINKDMTIVFEQLLDQMQSNVVSEIRVTNTHSVDEEAVDKCTDIDMNMIHMERMITKCKELDENISLCIQEIQNSKDSGNEISTFITLQTNKRIIAIVKTKFQELFETDNAHTRSVTSDDSPVNGDETELETPENMNDRNRTGDPDTSHKEATELQDYIDPFSSNCNWECGGKSKVDGNIISNKMIIGEVVLCSREEHELDYCVAKTDMANENYMIKENTNLNTTELPEPECEEYGNGNANYLAPTAAQNISRPRSNDKYVAFCNHPRSILRKQSKDRIIANGLVTDYYMNGAIDLVQDITVLRLQSAPPNRAPTTSKDEPQRPRSMHLTAQRDMVQWQNRKILESVEHERELNASDDESTTLNPTKTYYSGGTSGERKHTRRKKVFESSKSELKDKRKLNQHNHANKIKHLQRATRENANISNKKCCQAEKAVLSEKQFCRSSLKAATKNYQTSTETQRLRKWITQTEEMNKVHQNVSIRFRGMGTKTTDGVDEVYEANVDEYLSDFNVVQANLSIVPLMIKEATVITIANCAERQSSARSRTSDAEEDAYTNQSYAIRPTTQLFLTVEQIVRLPEDEKTCEINSISCMQDGRIIVSDFNNKLIKMFRVGWGRASSLYLDEPPHGVTVVANTTLAVISGLAYDRLLVINVGQYLTIKRRFKTGCVCRSICSYESHIYLLCLFRYKTEIRILNTDGVVSIRINLGHAIPSPKSIAVKPTDGHIYIADQSRGIFVVNRGRIVSRSSDKHIDSYYDVVVDINNNVFVCTNNPCRIYELNYDGKHMMPILLDDGVQDVRAIAVSTANNSLIAGCANSETIQIYKIIDTLVLKENQSV